MSEALQEVGETSVQASRARLKQLVRDAFDAYLLPALALAPNIGVDSLRSVRGWRTKILVMVRYMDEGTAIFLDGFVNRLLTSKPDRDRFLLALKKLESIAKEIQTENPSLDFVGEVIDKGPGRLLRHWEDAAHRGWYIPYPALLTSITALAKGGSDLDQFMSSYIKRHLDDFADQLIKLYPERAHILSAAFDLHRSGNYIASVPLVFAQIDGICAQNLKTFLFSDHSKRASKVDTIITSSTDSWESLFFSGFVWKTQMGADISKSRPQDKQNGPNRNGILHGSRKHLDYGSEMNSLKVLSMLFFVGFIFEARRRYMP